MSDVVAAAPAPRKGPIRHSIDEGIPKFGYMEFRCAVLDDETRVISGSEFMRVIGIYRSGALSTRRGDDGELPLPLHLAFKNLRPYIMQDAELVESLRTPIRYRDQRWQHRGGDTGPSPAAN